MFGRLFPGITLVLGNKSCTIGEPVYFPFKWCHICKEHVFVGRAAELSMWVAPVKGLPNLLCQSAYSAIDSCLVDWKIEF